MKYCRYKQINSASLLYKGFTLMEMLISMTVIAILMAVSAPMLTQFSTAKTGVDKNVSKCITDNDSSTWFTDTTGVATLPSTEPCHAAVLDTQYKRGRAYNTSTWYAEHGSSAQQLMAKKILRAACDQGGEAACDFFINHCWTGGSASAPYCDDTAGFADVTYYLHQDTNSNTNYGANYIYGKLQGLLPKMIDNLLNEVFYACNNDQTPDANQNLGSNFACALAQPSVFIEGCNYGNAAACQYAYDHDYNKSCTQVKTAWANAPTQTYKLTYNGVGSEVSVACNMSSLGSAAITGCNASPYVPLDCTAGYNNSYNRTCDMVISAWPTAPTATYNLTSSGPPPTAPVATTCTGPDPNCTDTIGALCPDGTKFAGIYNGKYYFVPVSNEPGTYTWNNGAFGITVGATSTSDGAANTAKILAANGNGDSPYSAANVCNDKNTTADNGHTDWYLPAKDEVALLYTNRVAIGNFTTAEYRMYYSSTEVNATNVYHPYFYNGDMNYYYGDKTSVYNVRCIRKAGSADATCPNIGNTCSDGTKYAGTSGGKWIFTTTSDESSGVTWAEHLSGIVSTGAVSTTNGKANTDLLVAATDSGSPYAAANACKGLSLANYKGHTDWFLPSNGELNLLAANYIALGLPSGNYWASTESAVNYAYRRNTSETVNYTSHKTNLYNIRCTRKSDLPLTNCTGTPGSFCTDGTYYVGYYDGRYIFTTADDEAGTYNYGPAVLIGTTSGTNGNTNQAIFESSGISSYPAAQACKALNTLSYKGHTDWYLPAAGEVGLLSAQMATLGLSGYYFSSTEYDLTDAKYINTAYPGSVFNYGTKWSAQKVRCVRDD